MARRNRRSQKNPKASKRQNNIKIQKYVTTNDIKSKTVFQNPVLCCQFLKDYVKHPIVQSIQPEDIEDYTSHYLSFFGVEYNSDTVKRIRIRDEKWQYPEIFFISLIEHKSKVDYNICIQLLKYITCIWAEYEKTFGTNYQDQVKTKSFRYPPILPVVYHEGTGTWTAPMHLKERIFLHEIFADYIPDFTYCLIHNQAYSNQELLDHQDEMSLIMLLNKIQTITDLSEFFAIPLEEINSIVKDSPTAVIDIIVMVMRALCTKLNLTSEETEECIQKVRTRDMGYLWENMQKIDVQAEREKSRKMRVQLQEEQAKMQEEQAKMQEEQAKMQEEQAKMQEEQAKMQAQIQAKQAELDAVRTSAQAELETKQSEIIRLRALLAKHGITLNA